MNESFSEVLAITTYHTTTYTPHRLLFLYNFIDPSPIVGCVNCSCAISCDLGVNKKISKRRESGVKSYSGLLIKKPGRTQFTRSLWMSLGKRVYFHRYDNSGRKLYPLLQDATWGEVAAVMSHMYQNFTTNWGNFVWRWLFSGYFTERKKIAGNCL